MDKNNKSLFLYTALIFFVAIILIILAFFGQTNLEKNQIAIESSAPQTSTVSGITEKASALSEENAKLVQEINSLKTEITTRDTTIEELNTKIANLTIIEDNNTLLFHAYESKLAGHDDDLEEILSSINYDQLTPEQKITYDNLKK